MLDLVSFLKKRIEDTDLYLREVSGKALKNQFKKLVRRMKENDELWEYHGSADVGQRYCYEYGWCIIRNGVVVEKEVIHCS